MQIATSPQFLLGVSCSKQHGSAWAVISEWSRTGVRQTVVNPQDGLTLLFPLHSQFCHDGNLVDWTDACTHTWMHMKSYLRGMFLPVTRHLWYLKGCNSAGFTSFTYKYALEIMDRVWGELLGCSKRWSSYSDFSPPSKQSTCFQYHFVAIEESSYHHSELGR